MQGLDKSKIVSNRLGVDGDNSIYSLSCTDSNPESNLDNELIEILRKLICRDRLRSTDNRYSHRLTAELSRLINESKDSIGIFSGSDTFSETVTRAFIEPGDNTIIVGPVVGSLHHYTERLGGSAINIYEESPFKADPEKIINTINRWTKIIYLANPNCFTGIVYSTQEIEYILNRINNAILVLDESQFRYSGISVVDLVNRYDNLVIVRSFPEALDRVAFPFSYLISRGKNTKLIKEVRTDKSRSVITEAAVIGVLKCLDSTARHIRQVRENMIYISLRLRGLGINCHSTPTNYLPIETRSPEKIIPYLRKEDMTYYNLRDLPGLERYISIKIEGDLASRKTISIFERIPEEYYLTRKTGGSKVTIYRSPETKEEITVEKRTYYKENV